MSNTRLLPADHGPMAVPKIPRAAMVARSSSVSKNSATRSATAIGPQRSRRYMSFLPSLRSAASGLKHGPEIAAAGIVDVRRRELQRVANHAANLFERLLKHGILCGIFLREPGNLLRGQLGVVVKRQSAAIGRERCYRDFRSDQLQSVACIAACRSRLPAAAARPSVPAWSSGSPEKILP